MSINMASQNRRNSKGYSGGGSDNGRKGSKDVTPESSSYSSTMISAPKYGTVVPERVFVGGISMNMSETELNDFFAKYGKVRDTKIIVDRGGVSKGYGFITFETEEEAKNLLADAENIMLRERKLNIAPAIKKQSFPQRIDVPNGTASMVGAPLFSTSLSYPFPNGLTYYCPHPSNTGMTAAPNSTTQPPPQPQPAPQTTTPTHIDPNLYTGYGGMQASGPPQYHQVVYNPPIYYSPAQYQYQVSTCEGVDGNLTDASGLQAGAMTAGAPVGPLMLTANGYYVQEIPYQDYSAYTHQYVYQPAPDNAMTQQHHTTLMQYSPNPAPVATHPRPVYDNSIIVPEVFPASHNVYPRPSSSNPYYQYQTNQYNTNSAAATYCKKYRRPYNPSIKSRGGGRGGGSVSSYSSGGGGGLVTPPSTPRSDQPSPEHQPTQSVSSTATDNLAHSMKSLKAA